MLFRTPAQKSDQRWSWARHDRAFFAAGACHVLARAFLQTDAGRGFHPVMITPDPGFRGTHVFCTDATTTFDYHGFARHDAYVAHFRRRMERAFPGWRGTFADIATSFWRDGWFEATQHRRPQHFLHDPTVRAERFAARLIAARAARMAQR